MANEKNPPEKVPGQDIPPADRQVGPADGKPGKTNTPSDNGSPGDDRTT